MDKIIIKALTKVLDNQKEIKKCLNEVVTALNLLIKILERQQNGKYHK